MTGYGRASEREARDAGRGTRVQSRRRFCLRRHRRNPLGPGAATAKRPPWRRHSDRLPQRTLTSSQRSSLGSGCRTIKCSRSADVCRAISRPLASVMRGLSRSLAMMPRRRSGVGLARTVQFPKLIVRVRFSSPAPKVKVPALPGPGVRETTNVGEHAGRTGWRPVCLWRPDLTAGPAT